MNRQAALHLAANSPNAVEVLAVFSPTLFSHSASRASKPMTSHATSLSGTETAAAATVGISRATRQLASAGVDLALVMAIRLAAKFGCNEESGNRNGSQGCLAMWDAERFQEDLHTY
jgi:hypothetical protein